MLRSLLRSAFVKPRASAEADASDPAANPLETYFFSGQGRLLNKWHHYFEIYHRHFKAFRGRSPVVVEVGVFHGGSLEAGPQPGGGYGVRARIPL